MNQTTSPSDIDGNSETSILEHFSQHESFASFNFCGPNRASLRRKAVYYSNSW